MALPPESLSLVQLRANPIYQETCSKWNYARLALCYLEQRADETRFIKNKPRATMTSIHANHTDASLSLCRP